MKLLKKLPYIASLTLLAYMPFHIFLSQSLSLLTGGLDIWKVWMDVFLLIAFMFTICLVWLQMKGTRLFNWLLLWVVVYGSLHLVLWAAHPHIYNQSAIISITDNMRLSLCLLLGYGAVLLLPNKPLLRTAMKLVLAVSTAVAVLGILQYFLPHDLLTHFGYSVARGARPAFYIDDNSNLPLRITSTIRDPNSLGAYLLLPAGLFTLLILRCQDAKRRYQLLFLLAIQIVAIFLTQSRSAWLGLVLSQALIIWWQYQARTTLLFKRFWPLIVVIVVVLGGAVFSLRNTPQFQNYIIHAHRQPGPTKLDSNDYHVLSFEHGIKGILQQPFGHGPGTAGLASIHNPARTLLTENYYVQLGYEIGFLGLALFIGLNVWLYMVLWRGRSDKIITALLAVFWAYALINMVLQMWANEAVAAQWWILAGMSLGTPTARKKR